MSGAPVSIRVPGRQRLLHVEGLRALAAYVVFIDHAFAQVWNYYSGLRPPSALSLCSYSLVAGHLAVAVFITISGFCLALPVLRDGDHLRSGTRDFLAKRARRILPPYYAALVACLILIQTVIGKPTVTLWNVQLKPSAILSHVVLLQNFVGVTAINYVFWSIAVEWQIYCLFPWLVAAWRKLGPSVVVTGGVAIGYAARLALGHTRFAFAAPHFVGLFTLGVLAAYASTSTRPEYVRARRTWPWGWIAASALAGACVLTGRWGWELSIAREDFIDLPIGVAAAGLLVYATTSEQALITRALRWKPLVFIGTFSYSVYLMHAPVLQILWQYVLKPLRLSGVAMFVALMGPGAIVVLGVAYAFHRLFEHPFMTSHANPESSRPDAILPPALSR